MYQLDKKTIPAKINLYLLYAILFSIVFSRFNLNSFFIILLFLIWVLQGGYGQRWEKLRNDNVFIAYSLYFALQLVGLLYTSDLPTGWKHVESKAGFFVLPLIFGSPGFLNNVMKLRVMLFFCAVVGAALGFGASLVRPPKYSLKMLVRHNELTKKTFAEAIDQLNNLAISKSNDLLGRELKMSKEEASKIVLLQGRNLRDQLLLEDTSNSKDLPFIIVAHVLDNSVSGKLQEGLVHYFNYNEYLKHIKDGKKKIYEEKLAFIERELVKLDSLKSVYNNFLGESKNNAMFYNNAFNPAEIYQRSNEYHYQKESIQNWLNDEYQSIRVIEGFKPSQRSSSASRTILVIFGALCGVVLGFLLGLFRDFDRMSKARAFE